MYAQPAARDSKSELDALGLVAGISPDAPKKVSLLKKTFHIAFDPESSVAEHLA